MRTQGVFLKIALVAVGILIGFWASWSLWEWGAQGTAEADLVAASKSLDKGDPVAAMNYAQAAVNRAPYAYDPYVAVGDVYARLCLPSAAKTMYEYALKRLASNGKRSVLAGSGVSVPPESATALLKLKMESLPTVAQQPCDASRSPN